MIRANTRSLRILRCRGEPRSVVPADMAGTAPLDVAATKGSIGPVVPQLHVDRLARYIPTDTSAFMVEEHRLTGAERATQSISTLLPWLVFGVFATAPFIVMKYNLEKMARVSEERADEPVNDALFRRSAFRQIQYKDMPEVIESRKPTLVGIFADNYHSSVLVSVLREVDRISDKFSIPTGVVVFDMASVDCSSFTDAYPPALGPYCQLISPGNKLVEYNGAITVEALLDFLVSDARITPAMREEVREGDDRVRGLQKCVFTRRFIQGKTWTVQDTLAVESVEAALARCVQS